MSIFDVIKYPVPDNLTDGDLLRLPTHIRDALEEALKKIDPPIRFSKNEASAFVRKVICEYEELKDLNINTE